MDAYEHNRQVELERTAYHKRRCEESPAYRQAYNSLLSLGGNIQRQNMQFVAAINGTECKLPEEETRQQEAAPIAALMEVSEANKEFDAKLIKKSGFEW